MKQLNNRHAAIVAYVFIIVCILVTAVVSALTLPQSVGAAGNGREDGCHTYNVFGHQDLTLNGDDVDFCGESAEGVTFKKTPSDITTSIPTVIVTTPPAPTNEPTVIAPTKTPDPTASTPTEKVPTETPATPKPEETKKPHCDKGEGNGGEGCDPGNNPDNGNDDEN